jgi:hypothetical protein
MSSKAGRWPFKPEDAGSSPVSPTKLVYPNLAEEVGREPTQSGFESRGEYHALYPKWQRERSQTPFSVSSSLTSATIST